MISEVKLTQKLNIWGFVSWLLKKKEGNHYVKGCLLLRRQAPKNGVFPDSLFVALFADGLQVHFVELGLDRHALVAGGAAELVHTPKEGKIVVKSN